MTNTQHTAAHPATARPTIPQPPVAITEWLRTQVAWERRLEELERRT